MSFLQKPQVKSHEPGSAHVAQKMLVHCAALALQ